jgi:hypothetical protein
MKQFGRSPMAILFGSLGSTKTPLPSEFLNNDERQSGAVTVNGRNALTTGPDAPTQGTAKLSKVPRLATMPNALQAFSALSSFQRRQDCCARRLGPRDDAGEETSAELPAAQIAFPDGQSMSGQRSTTTYFPGDGP